MIYFYLQNNYLNTVKVNICDVVGCSIVCITLYHSRVILTRSFPVHPFSTPWKYQKTLMVFLFFQGVEKGRIGNKWIKIFYIPN